MWRWILVVIAGLGLILGFMAVSTWNQSVTDRRNAEENRRHEEGQRKSAKDSESMALEQKELARMAGAAKAFLSSFGSKGSKEQLALTTIAFQDRNLAVGGIFQPPPGLVYYPHNGIYAASEFGTCQSGEFFYRGEVYRDNKEVGKFTLVMRRDKQDNAWRVDAVVVEMKE